MGLGPGLANVSTKPNLGTPMGAQLGDIDDQCGLLLGLPFCVLSSIGQRGFRHRVAVNGLPVTRAGSPLRLLGDYPFPTPGLLVAGGGSVLRWSRSACPPLRRHSPFPLRWLSEWLPPHQPSIVERATHLAPGDKFS